MATGVRLVIVESPAKAKTIQRYLGPGYKVEASVGHIRDLPARRSQVPTQYRDKPWGAMAVDVDDEFQPVYVVSPDKKAKVAELRKQLAGANELLLATDEDREGEAIAWHLCEVLKPKIPVRRMVFNEITPEAIKFAAENTRELDQDLVDAQETRRVIDRLYGYEVSPVLWKKVRSQLSAGRVQSVALRLIVEQERQRIAFTSAVYWDLKAEVLPGPFTAGLTSVDSRRVASSKDFGEDGQLRSADVLLLDGATAGALADALTGQQMRVSDVIEKPGRRYPAAPFTTSTLQQEASRKLRWGAQRTMRVAQGLYERGYITYMRTDSVTLSATAIAAARRQAAQLYGADHVPNAPRTYKSKVKNAQEAHEAIRPAGDHFRTPGDVAGELVGDEFALYDLIWKRTVASQMADARVSTTTIKLGVTSADGRACEFSASGTVVLFAGFLAAYEEGTDEEDNRGGEKSARLPNVAVGDLLEAESVTALGHETKPPARYTEASLVKELERLGIGRPSTYASIITTLLDRGYVVKRGSALVPQWLGFSVVRLLEEHFGELVDYDFTARLEEILDLVANGDAERLAVLRRFYFGEPDAARSDNGGNGGFPGLQPLVAGLGDINAREIASFPIRGMDAVVRVGKYGTYVESGDQRVSVPDELAPDEITPERAAELLATPSERELGPAPDTGRMVVAKVGRYGPYVTEQLTAEEEELTGRKRVKPRTGSLLKSQSVETITLEDALKLLSLPRLVGEHPSDGEPIMAQNGRYGPYLTHGKESRSLPDEESIFAITLDEALELLAQPKQRGRRAADPGVLIGTDPNSGGEIRLKNGRFGPYVTDGTTNASLRVADSPDALSFERAVELLADRRAAGPPAKKAGARRAPAKKTTAARKPAAKKTAAKKTTTAKKTTASKTTASKATAAKAAAAP